MHAIDAMTKRSLAIALRLEVSIMFPHCMCFKLVIVPNGSIPATEARSQKPEYSSTEMLAQRKDLVRTRLPIAALHSEHELQSLLVVTCMGDNHLFINSSSPPL